MLYLVLQLNFYEYIDISKNQSYKSNNNQSKNNQKFNEKDLINCYLTCKELYFMLNENIFMNLLKNKFSNNFIDKASYIINSWRECYYKIINFENLMLYYNCSLWTEKDYIKYWMIRFKNDFNYAYKCYQYYNINNCCEYNNLFKNKKNYSKEKDLKDYYENYYKNLKLRKFFFNKSNKVIK